MSNSLLTQKPERQPVIHKTIPKVETTEVSKNQNPTHVLYSFYFLFTLFILSSQLSTGKWQPYSTALESPFVFKYVLFFSTIFLEGTQLN